MPEYLYRPRPRGERLHASPYVRYISIAVGITALAAVITILVLYFTGNIFQIVPETFSPTRSPTPFPTVNPTTSPMVVPTMNPSVGPSTSPTASPSVSPSTSPTVGPSVGPSTSPSTSPSVGPSTSPTTSPSVGPSTSPTMAPTTSPSPFPTRSPLPDGVTAAPSVSPTLVPSTSPTVSPTTGPTTSPTVSPTAGPTVSPTMSPTVDNRIFITCPSSPNESPIIPVAQSCEFTKSSVNNGCANVDFDPSSRRGWDERYFVDEIYPPPNGCSQDEDCANACAEYCSSNSTCTAFVLYRYPSDSGRCRIYGRRGNVNYYFTFTDTLKYYFRYYIADEDIDTCLDTRVITPTMSPTASPAS